MARRDILESVHEPFGDAFYYGPERLSERFSNDAATRESSGFSSKTYKDVLNEVMDAGKDVSTISPLPHVHGVVVNSPNSPLLPALSNEGDMISSKKHVPLPRFCALYTVDWCIMIMIMQLISHFVSLS
jgi:hypothetical protein